MHKIIGFIPWGFSSTNPPENATDSARNRFEEQGLLLGSGGLPVARVTVTGSRVFWAHGSRIQAPGFRLSSSIAGFQSRPPIMEDRVLTGSAGYAHGSGGYSGLRVSSGCGLARKMVLLAHRGLTLEDRAPSPSTLSQHLSVSPSKTLSSISLLNLSISLSCLSLCGLLGHAKKKNKER
jgi:hypothetical protein